MLTEIKSSCPTLSDTIQQYMYGLVERCYICSNPEKILEIKDMDNVYPISGPFYLFERGNAFLGVKFKNREHALFLSSIRRLYREKVEKCYKKKLDTVYWEREYTPEEIWRDSQLKQHILQYTVLGKDLKLVSSLLEPMQQRQSQSNDEFQRMLDEILN